MSEERIAGCLFGLALGDAMGAPTEFMPIDKILANFPPAGPMTPSARVTDDTQMTLCVGQALLDADLPYTVASVEGPLRKHFVSWLESPENNRGPGRTCLAACKNLREGLPWHEATILNSKGCGANMRVAAIGLLSDGFGGMDQKQRAALAQFQAALTHGHPTALAASDLTAYAIHRLVQGIPPSTLPAVLREYAASQRRTYHHSWLGPLWSQLDWPAAEDFIQAGWDDCLKVLDDLDAALASSDRKTDPCAATGAGWVAEEALATGLLCFLLFSDDPVAAIRRASVTSGDSDSIACLTGAFAGAYHGMAAWPSDWLVRIEYQDRLTKLASALGSPYLNSTR